MDIKSIHNSILSKLDSYDVKAIESECKTYSDILKIRDLPANVVESTRGKLQELERLKNVVSTFRTKFLSKTSTILKNYSDQATSVKFGEVQEDKYQSQFLDILYEFKLELDILEFTIPSPTDFKSRCTCGNVSEIGSCSNCGLEEPSSNFTDTGRVKPKSQYRYIRVSRFLKVLLYIQGVVPVSEELVQKVKLLISRPVEEIEPVDIRHILKVNDLKNYDSYMAIWASITKRTPPNITNIIHLLVEDFKMMEVLFYKEYTHLNRTNFLNYPYVIYQLFNKHGISYPIGYFNMLSENKLKEMDHIVSDMFQKLEWSGFIPIATNL